MKILLAGATGVIGQRLIPLLTASGHEVIGMTRQASKTAHLRNLGVTPRVANALIVMGSRLFCMRPGPMSLSINLPI
jgi:uncharacterized protein YbjT (DUF2867 family)